MNVEVPEKTLVYLFGHWCEHPQVHTDAVFDHDAGTTRECVVIVTTTSGHVAIPLDAERAKDTLEIANAYGLTNGYHPRRPERGPLNLPLD